MKVKCIDTSKDLVGLTCGRVYDVEGENDEMYYLVCDDDGDKGRAACYWKTRFEIVEESPQQFALTEASRLAARIEAANTLAANIPQKTLWDEYAMAALTGLCTSNEIIFLEGKVEAACTCANLMMEARKNHV